MNEYIYANVRIPITLKPDNTIETLNDYIKIEFEKCDGLPEKNSEPVNYDIITKIKSLLNAEEETEKVNEEYQEEEKTITCSPVEKHETKEEPLTITMEELLNKTKKKFSNNTTFKKYKSRHLRNTMRVHP
jgi:hypothetical protein